MSLLKQPKGAPFSISTNYQNSVLPRFNAKIIQPSPKRRQLSLRIEKGLNLPEISRRSSMAMQARASPSSSSVILTSGASGRISALFSLRALRSLLLLIHTFILLLLLPFCGRLRRQASTVDKATGGPEEKKQVDGSGGTGRRPSGGASFRVPMLRWKAAPTTAGQEVATRRALAKRRVIQEDDDENCAREFSLFNTSHTLFTQSWTPVNVKIRGVVVLLHGLNEHSGRYSDFAKKLNGNGFKVYGEDWIGHGGSDGLHAYVHSLDIAVNDLKLFLEKVLADNPGLPCFCFGHSTGAAIVLKAVLDPKVEAQISGLVLTSPAIGVQPSHPIFAVLAPIVSMLLPRYQVGVANKKGLPVSRDPRALVAKYSDPLVYTGSIRVRTGYEILRITTFLQQNAARLRVPFLVLHGTADTVTDPEGSLKLYKEASSADKTIRLLEGYLHDLLFEPEKEAIAADIIQWLNSRV
ncbi:hypothetical protein SAY87_000885 [Trapa incisa]|uniref:Serine aminopeptidase S33 domain-containing protein n=1 Tax=Trapa incisa TaxID=236973 RepID=A0AAN7JGI8_9MYRT|nr:hypothetical protein SAY87_000885 [Trapa incisa]